MASLTNVFGRAFRQHARARPSAVAAVYDRRGKGNLPKQTLHFGDRGVLCPQVPRELTFPKARRLIRSAEFGHVRVQGTAARGNLITLAVAPAPDSESPARIGIIASRKVGAAVIRNRARRRVRDIFRKHQYAIKNGVWLVTIVSARAARASYEQLEDDWLRLARRASILTP